MRFSRDWHTQHIPHWLDQLKAYVGAPDVRYLEIGVFEGMSIIWILDNILTHRSSRAIGIDSWVDKDKQYQRALRNVRQLGIRKRKCKLIKGSSEQEVAAIEDNSIDICYIDGDHTAAAVLRDTSLCWPKVKQGGILIFDDYNLSTKRLNRGKEGTPKLAVDKIIKEYNGKVILKTGKQVFFKKLG